jgi:hypothetical protein
MPKHYVWFIDPKGDQRSNKLVSDMLRERSTENECWERLCQDGQSRNLWRCPDHIFIADFRRTVDGSNFAYDIYVSEGLGRPRLWTFEDEPFIYRRSVIGRTPIRLLHREAAEIMTG